VSGASGYEVYQATSGGEPDILVGTIPKGSTIAYKNTGLAFNEISYYKVRAYRIVGGDMVYGAYSSTVNAKTALSKAGSPKATAPNHKSVKISWKKVSGADGYEIYRATSSGGTYSLLQPIDSGAKVSFTHTGLTAGKTYYYKIRPYRMDGGIKVNGSFSAVLKATPQYGTVYWVPNGAVFHVDKNCKTLSRSKTILSGSVAESGKPRVCNVCG